MANITKVPNGPLIKKKGPFKGSTLKSGGVVKKAQEGATMSPYMQKRAAQQLVKEKNIRARDSILNRNASAKGMTREQVQKQQVADKNKPDAPTCDTNDPNFKSTKCGISKAGAKESKSDWKKKRNGGPVVKKAQKGGTYYASSKGRVGRLSSSNVVDNIYSTQNESMDTTGYAKGKKEFIKTKRTTLEKPSLVRVKREDVPKVISEFKKGSTQKMDLRTPNQKKKSKMKAGGMIKRADGSMSRRGLWDNLRANKGSGKKPTAAMLKQEKKIKAKTKK